MIRRAALLALLVLGAGSDRALSASETRIAAPDTLVSVMLPPAYPGAVVTASVDIPRDQHGKGIARFVVAPGPRVRLFGPAQGLFPSGRVPDRLPLTFTLPRDQEAGPLLVARVTIRWADGTEVTTELLLQVQPVRRLRLSTRSATSASADQPLLIRYRVDNLGNATDTVDLRLSLPARWKVPPLLPRLVIPSADSAAGSVSVRISRDVPLGSYSVAVMAAGRGDTTVANAYFSIGDENPGSIWARVPGTLFVGMPALGVAGAAPQVALQASGALDPSTQLSLSLRHGDDELRPPAFNRYTGGPEYNVSLERPTFRIAGGDILASESSLLGSYGLGTGGEVAFQRKVFGDVFLARPHDFGGGSVLDGHLARATVGYTLPFGDLALRAADFERPLRSGLPSDGTTSAMLTYDSGRRGAQQLSIAGGFGSVRGDSGLVRSGAVVDAAYSYQRGAAFLMGRLRRVPGLLPGAGGGNESFLGIGVPIFSGLQAVGWGSASSLPIVGLPTSSHRDAAFGLRAFRDGATLQATGHYVEVRAPGSIAFGGSSDQKSVALLGSVPVGPLSFDASGEVGDVSIDGSALPMRTFNARTSWRSTALIAWTGINYYQGRFGSTPLALDAGLSGAIAGIRIDGGASANLPAGRPAYLGQAWGALLLPFRHGIGVLTGAQYQPWLPDQRIRFSLGLKTTLNLPIPVPARAGAEGVVFEDRNLNGVRDPGEPPIPGASLRLGATTASTDARGRFAFPRRGGKRPDLDIDMGSLPSGWLSEPFARSARKADVPLVRSGGLRIRLIAENTEGALPDSAAPPVANLAIDLTDAAKRERNAQSDSTGTIRFNALPPGSYVLTVHAVTARGEPLRDIVVPLEVPYGALRDIFVRVPSNELRVRFKPSRPTRSDR